MPFVLLDSYPLSLITNPAAKAEHLACMRWAQQLVRSNIVVAVPEIIDYELRRTLVFGKKLASVQALNLVGKMGIVYYPLSTEIMLKGAQLWAWARQTGQKTAHDERIDIDVILASQAITLASQYGDYVVVATIDTDDINRYTPAKKWQEITIENCFSSMAR
ncbi:MAG: hypothetical protein JO235_12475 [Chroococcidiopsidaceae cyanobacterium CP_BM_RX_35]|nr:hypothetical protein [Chroococcidiopsidaceae cyanobacterium CP_BM_RX_35]